MDSQKQQVVERLKQANNILVTVSSNPSVDQLAACIGLTLALNKLGKHATAVFSGNIPSTIEFLQPEKTLEKNTDSLRDFIIALDKSKADKLRYKVEDRVVKIFITPYRTSISQKDLDFSQGDFNVDVVLTLGVHVQTDLDQAITAHGRILHDATVMSINVKSGGELGSVNWVDINASSLSELAVQLSDGLDRKLIDGQVATAFLTGIVAETDRFSNQKTSPQTMSISAELMAAGANQQLVASEIEKPAPVPAADSKPVQLQEEKTAAIQTDQNVPPKPNDGTIEISHDERNSLPSQSGSELPAFDVPPSQNPTEDNEAEAELPPVPEPPQIHIDTDGRLRPLEDKPPTPQIGMHLDEGSHIITEPPMMGVSPLTANAMPESYDDQPSDPLTLPSTHFEPLLNREPLGTSQNQPSPTPIISTPTTSLDTPGASLPPLQTSSFTDQNSVQVVPPAPSAPANQWDTPVVMPQNPTPAFVPQPVTPMSYEPTPTEPAQSSVPAPTETLSQIEQDVNSPHASFVPPVPTSVPMPPAPSAFELPQMPTAEPELPQAQEPMPSAPTEPNGHSTNVNSARDAVMQAINGDPNTAFEPQAAFNAMPVDLNFRDEAPAAPAPSVYQPGTLPTPQMPGNYAYQQPQNMQTPTMPNDPNMPPAGPPPMMPFNPGQ